MSVLELSKFALSGAKIYGLQNSSKRRVFSSFIKKIYLDYLYFRFTQEFMSLSIPDIAYSPLKGTKVVSLWKELALNSNYYYYYYYYY